MWEDIIVAIALVLVLEGIFPFLRPEKWRFVMEVVTKQSDNLLRIMGLGSMLMGVSILYLVRT